MELKLIAGTKIYIGLPSYDGSINNQTHAGLMRLQKVCTMYGIGLQEDLFSGSSLIEMSRNRIVRNFLETDSTHLVFIDADVGFFGDHILQLISHNKDIIGAVYPRKQFNWNNIKESIKQNPDINPDELEMLAVDYAYRSHNIDADYSQIMQLKYPEALPTGFLSIKRGVFEKMFNKVRSIATDDGEIKEFFHVDVNGKLEINRNGTKVMIPRHVSEDFFFSYLAYKNNIEVWLDPTIPLMHTGTYGFRGNLQKIVNLVKGENTNGK